ncbi:MAG: NAD(P)/FAD-dependent oxidoreductase [Candidatus Dormibacteraeota bacterium]|nr:NAD(P)/FAD-dependent oxidoreductase [Candidatus Dormibacteraeota bacterium]
MTDLLVIGGGPGGVAAAHTAVRMGASVCLAERGALGGVCVHAGCIPAGAFHRTTDLLGQVRRAGSFGLELSGAPRVDWQGMQRWVGSVVTRAASMTRASLEAARVEILSSPARFASPGRVEVGGRVFEGVPIVLATGAASFVPDAGAAAGCPVFGNDEAMALDRAPERLLVAGAGRFSAEWADFFSQMGSRVTVVAGEDRLLPGEDADLAGYLQLLLEERGVIFEFGRPSLEGLEADAVLFADSRRPNLGGVEAAGLETGAEGGVIVDDGGRTSAPAVFAAGDVTGPPWLSNRARAQGMAAATNALGGSARVRPERLPRSVNTHPELAAVGLTEEQARARGIEPAVGFGELATSLRAVTLGEDRGALKLVVDPEFGEILGAHMVGVGATEVIAQVAAAIELEADYRDLAKVHHLHPSLAELVTDAVAAI